MTPSRSTAKEQERELAKLNEPPPDSDASWEQEAHRWRALYERERERLAKLWVAFRDVEQELARLKGSAAEPSTASVVVPTTVVYEKGAAPTGPYMYNGYTLHSRMVKLKNAGEQTIYFFAKRKPKRGSPVALPEGFVVRVSDRTGLPYLQREGATEKEVAKHLRPQCVAVTDAGGQCRNSARHGSRYCASHKGYQPKTAAALAEAVTDTHPNAAGMEDTLPAMRGRGVGGEETTGPAAEGETQQCLAVGGSGKQCKNSARVGSNYCAVHKGYHPKSPERLVEAADTRPRVRGAKDTVPAIRAR